MYDPVWQHFTTSDDIEPAPGNEGAIDVVRVADNGGMVVITVNPGDTPSLYLHLTQETAAQVAADITKVISESSIGVLPPGYTVIQNPLPGHGR